MKTPSTYDAIIIGGSYAGLSGAMALGRSLRKVLVLDAGEPCNRQTPHSHNFLTRDGATPAELAAISREQVLQYPTVELKSARVKEVQKEENSFQVSTTSGESYTASRILLATGIKDEFPDIDGLTDCWGISALHCPYCHGYEVRNQPTALLANGDAAEHLGVLLTNWTKDLVVLTNGASSLSPEKTQLLQRLGVPVIETTVKRIVHENGYLQAVQLSDGTELKFQAMYTRVPFSQYLHIAGCDLNDAGFIKVDEMQRTTVPGIYAAGDNCSGMRAVANAVATGNKAGAMINAELVMEAVAARS